MQVKKSYFDCWHCIVPVGLGREPAKVKEMVTWCRNNITDKRWGYEDLYKETSFILYSEKDVVNFSLRWG
jgi:hypothetical protein